MVRSKINQARSRIMFVSVKSLTVHVFERGQIEQSTNGLMREEANVVETGAVPANNIEFIRN